MADNLSSVVDSAMTPPADPVSTNPRDVIMTLPAEIEKKRQVNLDKFKAQEQDSLQKTQAMRVEMQKKYDDWMAKITPTPDANLQDVPDAPNQKFQDPTQVLGSLGTILAIFGSMKTRAPMTSALNSMAAAMKGFHQGDQEAIKLNTEKWQNDFKKALANNQIEMQKYTQILEKNKWNYEMAQGELRSYSVQIQDQQMQDAINNGDFQKQDALLVGRQNGGMKGAETLAKMNATETAHADAMRAHQDAEHAKGWAIYQDPKTQQMMRANAITGEVLPFKGDTTGLQKPGAGGSGQSSISPGDMNLTGEAYLKSLPQGMGDVVKAMAEGRMPFPSAFAMRYPYWQSAIQAMAHYQPENLNVAKYNVRLAVQKDFTSGKTATNITAINTAIGHMGTLNELVKAENNNDIATVNKIVNTIKTETGDPAINNAQEAAHAVASELMRVFRGVGASDTGVENFESKLDVNKGPQVIEGALQTGAQLLASRIGAIQDQWKRGMDTKDQFPNLLSPHSAQTLESLGVKSQSKEVQPVGSGGPKEGDKGTSKSGRPMHFDGSHWIYDQ